MNRGHIFPILTILMAALVPLTLGGCGGGADKPDAGDDGEISVYTTFYPTTYFTRRIGGEHVDVTMPVPADADPIFWTPPDPIIRNYQQAELIVLNGAGFEKWAEKISLPPSRILNTAEPYRKQWIKYEEAITHRHGPSGEHAHTGLDGHTWLDPQLAKQQARAIRDALIERAPDHENAFEKSFRSLADDLDALHEKLNQLSETIGDRPLLASHPAYNYPARRYGWNLLNLDLDPATMPDEQQLADLEAKLEDHPAKLLIWESEPKPQIAQTLQQRFKLSSVVFAPAELLDPEDQSADRDYLSIMNRNVQRLRQAIESLDTSE